MAKVKITIKRKVRDREAVQRVSGTQGKNRAPQGIIYNS